MSENSEEQTEHEDSEDSVEDFAISFTGACKNFSDKDHKYLDDILSKYDKENEQRDDEAEEGQEDTQQKEEIQEPPGT